MDYPSHYELKIDAFTFELKTDDVVKLNTDIDHKITIDLPNSYLGNKLDLNIPLSFRIQRIDNSYCRIESANITAIIDFDRKDLWETFLAKHSLQFIGLISTAFLSNGNDGYIWVEPFDKDRALILSLFSNPKIKCYYGFLNVRDRLTDIERDFWMLKSDDDERYRKQFGTQLLKTLNECIGFDISSKYTLVLASSTEDGTVSRRLEMKVHPSELWFLLFPFDYFCKYQNSYFATYGEVEWIVTPQKTFIQNAIERNIIKRELQDVDHFVKYTVIVLNTYKHFDETTCDYDWRGATDLAVDLLSLLKEVRIGKNTIPMRWYLNPSKQDLYNELTNPNTHYIFANFHSENQNWYLGNGEKKSWKNSINEISNDNSNIVTLSDVKNLDLSHFRLMRIFHCSSIIDTYLTEIQPSMGLALLEAGAIRVEGSIMEENYIDYIQSILKLLLSMQGLGFILKGKCYEANIDFNTIVKHATELVMNQEKY